LNIEQIFNENSSKSKLKHHRGIWAHSWWVGFNEGKLEFF
jgi:hypothetical protein